MLFRKKIEPKNGVPEQSVLFWKTNFKIIRAKFVKRQKVSEMSLVSRD